MQVIRKSLVLDDLLFASSLKGFSTIKLISFSTRGMKNTIEIADISMILLYKKPVCLKRRNQSAPIANTHKQP